MPWAHVEALLAAVLACIGILRAAELPADVGAEGLVGWALAGASIEAVGWMPALLFWILVAAVSLLASLRIGAQRVAASQSSIAAGKGASGARR